MLFSKDQTFKKSRKFMRGGNASALHEISSSSFGSIRVKDAVKCPPNHDVFEWIAVNTVDFYNQVSILYGNLEQFCTAESCPTMNAGPKYMYLWADGEKVVQPLKCTATDYVGYLLEWVQSKLDDHNIFPAEEGDPFGEEFLPTVKAIFKRMFRVYAHIYYNHFKDLESLGGAETYCNMSFKHFIFFAEEFQLVEKGEVKPLSLIIKNLREREAARASMATITPQTLSTEAPHQSIPSNITVEPTQLNNFRPLAVMFGCDWEAQMQTRLLEMAGYEVVAMFSKSADAAGIARLLLIKFQTDSLAALFSQSTKYDMFYVSAGAFDKGGEDYETLVRVMEYCSLNDVFLCMSPLCLPLPKRRLMLDNNQQLEKERQSKRADDLLQEIVSSVNHPLRALPATQCLFNEIFGKRSIGRVLNVSISIQNNWKSEITQQQMLKDLMSVATVNCFDLLTWLFGTSVAMVNSKFSCNRPDLGDGLDYASLLFEMDDGVTGAINLSFTSQFAKHQMSVEVSGTEGHLSLADNRVTLTNAVNKDLVLVEDTSEDTQSSTELPAHQFSAGFLHFARGLKLRLFQKYAERQQAVVTLSDEQTLQIHMALENSATIQEGFKNMRFLEAVKRQSMFNINLNVNVPELLRISPKRIKTFNEDFARMEDQVLGITPGGDRRAKRLEDRRPSEWNPPSAIDSPSTPLSSNHLHSPMAFKKTTVSNQFEKLAIV